MGSKTRDTPNAHERLEQLGPRVLSDAELLVVLLGPTTGANNVRDAALRLLDEKPLTEIAWASAEDLQQVAGIGRARAAALVAAFELGRRGAWAPPKRGERVLDPARVYELLREVAHAEREQFHVVLLDVRCRLIKTLQISEGSLTQCPVSPRDVLREALRAGAHGVIFAHNHPSGAVDPSAEDSELTERLRAASELVGLNARDHLILATGGYYSFVEAGRWRR
jgi:DNA repair protein RadC